MYVAFQMSCVEVLTPSVAVFGDDIAKEVIKVKWGHKHGKLIWRLVFC